MTKDDRMLFPVERFFDERVKAFGPTPRAVDYNSKEAQEVRFLQLKTGIPQQAGRG